MELTFKLVIAVLCAGFLIVGLLLLQVLRYEYNTYHPDVPRFTIRIDKLNGEACFIPFSSHGKQYAQQALEIEQCK
jgi:hypothetical protein